MNSVEKIAEIKKSLPGSVKLVAVTKSVSPEIITGVYDAGYKIFGENKVQELVGKYQQLPKDIEWHFIGHLQRNKVKLLAPFVSMIHGVDSFRVLKTINNEALKNNRIIPCLLQFHIADEATKFGFSEEEAYEMLDSSEFKELKNITISGVMGMATFTEDKGQVRDEFRMLKRIFDTLKKDYFKKHKGFREISMGMSDDYKIALEEGSTIVRIGSIIFGAR